MIPPEASKTFLDGMRKLKQAEAGAAIVAALAKATWKTRTPPPTLRAVGAEVGPWSFVLVRGPQGRRDGAATNLTDGLVVRLGPELATAAWVLADAQLGAKDKVE